MSISTSTNKHSLFELQTQFCAFLSENRISQAPQNLYAPVNYIMSIGGKRIRPILCLMACELFDGQVDDAMFPALGIEYFHNFTLVHDDVMDEAPLRRGKPTIHNKYGLTAAILSGDATMIKAYECIAKVKAAYLPSIIQIFNQTALEICEGQQYDMDFETQEMVTIPAYLRMIELKTAVLLAASLQIGAIIAGATPEQTAHLYAFGRNIGLAFQLMDDVLDTYGTTAKVGKRIGGDILQNKKTYLLVQALSTANAQHKATLNYWLQQNDKTIAEQKIAAVKEIYNALGVRKNAEAAMQAYYQQAFAHLQAINVPESNKKALVDVVQQLMYRQQ